MKRHPDWRRRLELYLRDISARAYRPGQHDCALFVAGAIHAMTGTDPARGWRGYGSLKTGQARLREKGFADHVALVASLLPEITPILARAGDIAVVNSHERDGIPDALGVVQGAGIYVLRRTGIGMVPLADATKAFRL